MKLNKSIISRALIRGMNDKDWNVSSLSKELNMSRQTLQKIIDGGNYNIDNLLIVVKFLEVEILINQQLNFFPFTESDLQTYKRMSQYYINLNL